jgi:hypothetical protein
LDLFGLLENQLPAVIEMLKHHGAHKIAPESRLFADDIHDSIESGTRSWQLCQVTTRRVCNTLVRCLGRGYQGPSAIAETTDSRVKAEQ